MGYDFDRPYIDKQGLSAFIASDPNTVKDYGAIVKAIEISNKEYKLRFDRFHGTRRMKNPPSSGRIFPGYAVIRKLNTPDEYETWIPDDGFEDIYQPHHPAPQA